MQHADRGSKPGVGPKDLTPQLTELEFDYHFCPTIIDLAEVAEGEYRLLMQEMFPVEG